MNNESITNIGKRVIRTEYIALKILLKLLPEDFSNSVKIMAHAKGRVVISGVGKSGHIGRKIAATLASTGTPSQFIHATEANHGDLGMITEDDICLLISNSGETQELKQIIQYTRRFQIPLISISSNMDSTLMQNSDYRLNIPSCIEACLTNLVPSVSTTLTLALGDALAIALMELKGFNSISFGVFHPGGKLGSQFLKIKDLMHTNEEIPLISSTAMMSDVILLMTSKGFGLAGVISDDKLIGVISDGDLRRHMDGLLSECAEKVSTKNPVTVKANTLGSTALSIMNENKINCLFVVEDNLKPIGIIHIHDLLRAGVI